MSSDSSDAIWREAIWREAQPRAGQAKRRPVEAI